MSTYNETEQRILDSARKLFILKGYHGTTVEDIVKEAGCTELLFPFKRQVF